MKSWVLPVLVLVTVAACASILLIYPYNPPFGLKPIGYVVWCAISIPVAGIGYFLLLNQLPDNWWLTEESVEKRARGQKLAQQRTEMFVAKHLGKEIQYTDPPSDESEHEMVDRLFFEYLELGRYSDPPRPPRGGGFTMEDAGALSSELERRGIVEVNGDSTSLRNIVSIARSKGYLSQSSYEQQKGNLNPSLACRFCGNVGGVRVKKDSVTQEFRQSDAVGKVIGVGFETERAVLSHYCENCGESWHD